MVLSPRLAQPPPTARANIARPAQRTTCCIAASILTEQKDPRAQAAGPQLTLQIFSAYGDGGELQAPEAAEERRCKGGSALLYSSSAQKAAPSIPVAVVAGARSRRPVSASNLLRCSKKSCFSLSASARGDRSELTSCLSLPEGYCTYDQLSCFPGCQRRAFLY